jgi:hypothetical protein
MDGDDGDERSAAERIIRELVLENGGATEAEAALLLRVLARLRRIEAEEGAAAAEAAARAVRRAWFAEPDR